VILQTTLVEQQAASATIASSSIAVSVCLPSVETLLADLPSAHRALPIGRRRIGQGCHGVRTSALTTTRLRFVYFGVSGENDPHASYHRQLVHAEVMLARLLAARASGMRPIDPTLDYADEARATVRPPREMFSPTTLEYRRWFDHTGASRAQPLTREEITEQLITDDGLSSEEARLRSSRRCHALPADDQAWLIERRAAPLQQRPLNRSEFDVLVAAIEAVFVHSAGNSHAERANRQISLRAAAMLGSLLDQFVATPFSVPMLCEAFAEHHLAHLRRSIESSRQAEAESGVLLAGPKAWFAAKAVRMRAEHQLGLANPDETPPRLRLLATPVTAFVGGRLFTYVNGRRRGRPVVATTSPFDAIPKSLLG